MVCLPGLRGSAEIFAPLHAELPTHESRLRAAPGPLWPLALPPGSPALAAARLLPHLPPGRFHVLTGSYGGLVARFLPHHRLASLVCVGTLPSPAFLEPRMATRARWMMALPDPLLAALYHQHGRRSLAGDGVQAAVVDQVCAEPLAAPVLRARLRAVLSGHHGSTPPGPVAWVTGTDDPHVSWSPADLKAVVPHAVSITVPGRHFPHASHPAAFWREVQEAFPAWQASPPGPDARSPGLDEGSDLLDGQR